MPGAEVGEAKSDARGAVAGQTARSPCRGEARREAPLGVRGAAWGAWGASSSSRVLE